MILGDKYHLTWMDGKLTSLPKRVQHMLRTACLGYKEMYGKVCTEMYVPLMSGSSGQVSPTSLDETQAARQSFSSCVKWMVNI